MHMGCVSSCGQGLLLGGRVHKGHISTRMSLDVLAEVVTPHESLVAHWASKALLPSVCSEVASKLI